jgi:hypothetical protein
MLGQEPRVLDPSANAIHEGESGESNGVGKEDIGSPHLPVLFGREVSPAPWLLRCPEGYRVFPVVVLKLCVRDVLGNLNPARYGPGFTWWGCPKSCYPALVEVGDPERRRPSRNVMVGPMDDVNHRNT